jgi:ubiquinone/menaquinone biosynthesis C-methylase UbiE
MQKKQIYSPIKTILFLFFGIIVLFITASSFISMVGKYASSRRELVLKKQEYIKLEKKKAESLALYNSLETQEGRELYIREKYRVVKPGEELIILSERDEESLDTTQKRTLWQKIKRIWE